MEQGNTEPRNHPSTRCQVVNAGPHRGQLEAYQDRMRGPEELQREQLQIYLTKLRLNQSRESLKEIQRTPDKAQQRRNEPVYGPAVEPVHNTGVSNLPRCKRSPQKGQPQSSHTFGTNTRQTSCKDQTCSTSLSYRNFNSHPPAQRYRRQTQPDQYWMGASQRSL